MKTPYLIQRATIKTPLAAEATSLSRAVNLDYMGSSEFEWGALPASLRVMEAQADSMVMRLMPEIMEDGEVLRVYSPLSDKDWDQYHHYLMRLRGDSGKEAIRLKEWTNFNPREWFGDRKPATNFWWDIQNHVMWAFDKPFMDRLPHFVASNIHLLNEKRKAAQ